MRTAKKRRPSQPFMQPWRPTGASPRRAAADRRKAQGLWKRLMWVSLLLRLTLPTLALWVRGWTRAQPLSVEALATTPLWWAVLALACAYNTWQLFPPLLILFKAFKEWLYRRWERRCADLLATLALAGLARAGWAALHSGRPWLAPPAASLGLMAGLMALGFAGHALSELWAGPRSLRLEELDPAGPSAFARPKGLRGRLAVAHLSDLHLTAGRGVRSTTGKPGGNAAFKALLKAHAKVLLRQQAVLLTGDLADAGRAREWRAFFTAWDRHGLAGRGVLAPGNHEINIIDPGDRFAVDPAHSLRAKRLVRTLAALDRLQGERAWIWRQGRPVRLRRHLAGHAAALRAFMADPSWDAPAFSLLNQALYALTGLWPRAGRAARAQLALVEGVWEASFPMLVELPRGRAMAVVLDSNVAAKGFWDNALGEIHAGQLERLASLRQHPRFRAKPKLVLLHHHVALPRLPWSFLRVLEADLMALKHPRALLRSLPAGPQLILHGHKHLAYFGRLPGPVQVACAPSSTLADERDPRHPLGFFTLAVALGRDRAALAGAPAFHSYRSQKIGP